MELMLQRLAEVAFSLASTGLLLARAVRTGPKRLPKKLRRNLRWWRGLAAYLDQEANSIADAINETYSEYPIVCVAPPGFAGPPRLGLAVLMDDVARHRAIKGRLGGLDGIAPQGFDMGRESLEMALSLAFDGDDSKGRK